MIAANRVDACEVELDVTLKAYIVVDAREVELATAYANRTIYSRLITF